MRVIDRVSGALGLFGALLMFMTGVFLTFEVTARYVFRAPTSWAQEVSEMCLLWGVFLMLAMLIRGRQNIAIDALYARLKPAAQRGLDVISLVFVLVFLIITVRAGVELATDSFTRGTTTGTMVDIPSYWEEAAVPFGCAWAAVQTLVEIVRAVTGQGWQPMLHAGAEH